MVLQRPVKTITTGTKLSVTNLSYETSPENIRVSMFHLFTSRVLLLLRFNMSISSLCVPQELFSEIGDLKNVHLFYDKSGRSTGRAEIVFTKRSDAEKAIDEFNNVS